MLVADMQARGVVNINQVLASPTTSLVWVQAFLPPGVQKGDPLDVEVRVPPNHETTDLSRRLDDGDAAPRKSGAKNGGSVTTATDGRRQGPVLVDP